MEQCIQEMQYNMMKEYIRKKTAILWWRNISRGKTKNKKKLFNKDSDFNGWMKVYIIYV